jgi:hypothetical protein
MSLLGCLGIWSFEFGAVVSCQLSVVSCQLSVVSCQLSVVSCQLSVVSCQGYELSLIEVQGVRDMFLFYLLSNVYNLISKV